MRRLLILSSNLDGKLSILELNVSSVVRMLLIACSPSWRQQSIPFRTSWRFSSALLIASSAMSACLSSISSLCCSAALVHGCNPSVKRPGKCWRSTFEKSLCMCWGNSVRIVETTELERGLVNIAFIKLCKYLTRPTHSM